MKLSKIVVGVYQENCYILMDEDSKEAVVIDPGDGGKRIIDEISNMEAQVRYILLTHGHADHTGAVSAVKEVFNIPVCINEKDKKMILDKENMFGPVDGSFDADILINGKSTFVIGEHEIKCIETPGHTPGGMCFLTDDLMFTGDTLFQGSVGRTDFPGGDMDALIDSVKNKLMVLPEDILVLPGHGPETTLKNEKTYNPYM